MAPCDDVALAPAAKSAMASGIPVVAVDNGVVGVELTLVATDNAHAASLAAEYIGEALNGQGNVVLINGIISQGSGQGRYSGFVEYIHDNYPDIVIVESINADWDSDKALAGIEEVVNSGTQVDAVSLHGMVGHCRLTQYLRRMICWMKLLL